MNKGKTTLLIAILGCLLAVSLGLIGLIVYDLGSYESVSYNEDTVVSSSDLNVGAANTQLSVEVENNAQESKEQNKDKVQETIKQEDKVDTAYLAKVELLDEPVREAVKNHVSKTKRKVDLSAPVVTSEVAQQVVNKSKDIRVIILLKEPEFKQNVLSSLLPDEFELNVESSDWIAGMINNESLEKLEENVLVKKVMIDRKLKTATAQSFPQINADKVTNLMINGIGINGTGQSVCVVDSGVKWSHPELGGAGAFPSSKVIGGYDYCGGNGPGCGAINDDPQDAYGHGTGQAGIIAADGPTYKGIAPGATIVALKATADGGFTSYTSQVANGVKWCVDNATTFNITTIYVGFVDGATPMYPADADCVLQAGDPIVDQIQIGNSKNITTIIPSGNNGVNDSLPYPAGLDCAISVGSVEDGSDVLPINTISSFTNKNDSMLDLLAPGNIINVLDLTGTGGGTGTSEAAAHVAGAALLLRQYNEVAYNKIPTPSEIRNIFRATGINITDTVTGQKYPRIDIYRAVHYETFPPNIQLLTANNSYSSANAQINFNATDNEHGIDRCSLYLNGKLNFTNYAAGKSCEDDWGTCNTGLDDTVDGCDAGSNVNFQTGGGGGVNNIFLNDSVILAGQPIEVTCQYDVYQMEIQSESPDNHEMISYNNGSGVWRTINQTNLSGDNVQNVTITFVPDNVVGTQYFRCSALSNGPILNNCAYENTNPTNKDLHDNDDISFTVTNDELSANEIQEGINTFGMNLSNGTYNYSVECYDDSTIPNRNVSDIYWLNVDADSPIVKLESPANNSLLTANPVVFNYNVTDATTNVSNCTLFLNSTANQTNTTVLTEVTQNFTLNLANGNYNWSVKCYDYVNNLGFSAENNFSINTPPTWNPVPSDRPNLELGNAFSYDVDAVDSDALVYAVNDTVNFTINSATGLIENNTFLAIGTYNLKVNATDTVNNFVEKEFKFSVVDTTLPVFTTGVTTQTKEFALAGVSQNIAATDAASITYSVNDTNFSINGAGLLINATQLAVGIYNLKVTATDANNNAAISIGVITVSDTIVPVFTTGVASQTKEFALQGVSQNIAATDAAVVTYSVNDTNFSINGAGLLINATQLAVGIYNLKVTATDANNNAATSVGVITVSDTIVPVFTTGVASQTKEF
ncbi:S8 family serine peptidase, partial [Candidatus Woesearchaeota archaeon]|nr:S8 family serine peptidase [Candidatus Woesearchaeota archaeon]